MILKGYGIRSDKDKRVKNKRAEIYREMDSLEYNNRAGLRLTIFYSLAPEAERHGTDAIIDAFHNVRKI